MQDLFGSTQNSTRGIPRAIDIVTVILIWGLACSNLFQIHCTKEFIDCKKLLDLILFS